MAEARCSHHRIRFLGRVSYDRVPALMQEAEVLLFPSRHDGFGMVTMEALAAGRPVVASRAVMSARQYIRPGKNGWLLPAEDAPAWSEQIEAILDAREQLPRWGQAARDMIRSRYCVKEDVSRLLRFLDNLPSVQSSVPSADLPE
jgi:glycosyltransferase involved in cell wall biosynthesis